MRKKPLTSADIRRAHARAVGGRGRKICRKGKSCGAACIAGNKDCILLLPEPLQEPVIRVRNFLQERVGGGGSSSEPADYSKWSPIAQGNYGRVSISPDGTRAVKELLTGKDGKQGQFGPHEVELAKKMGELGHSPVVHRVTDKTMEMDVARGKPLWEGYRRKENEDESKEPSMNTAQAAKAAAALRDLHRLGFAHNDNHALQWIVDGDNVKLVDFGLSRPLSNGAVYALQDLSKIAKLVQWDNPELAGNRYVQLVNKYLTPYREIKGVSKGAKEEKERLAQQYLQELRSLE